MPNADKSYASYLLRFRCVQGDQGRTWVASIQSTATSEQRRFANLDALLQFLRDRFGECARDKKANQPAIQETEATVLTEPGSPDGGRAGDGHSTGDNLKGGDNK